MEKQRNIAIESSVTDVGCAVKATMPREIPVTVRIPENMNEISKRQKINRIYDILKPKASR